MPPCARFCVVDDDKETNDDDNVHRVGGGDGGSGNGGGGTDQGDAAAAIGNGGIVVGSDEHFVERRYGCYKFGIIAAGFIILILIIGTVPVFFAINDTNTVLIVTIISLIIVGFLLLGYCLWQRQQANKMKQEISRREMEYLGRTA